MSARFDPLLRCKVLSVRSLIEPLYWKFLCGVSNLVCFPLSNSIAYR